MLDFIDFLGPQISLTIKRNNRFRSNIGVVASTLLIFIAGAVFFGFGRDIFEREKPIVTFNRIPNDDTPYFLMTEKNFVFAIYDQQSNEPIPEIERRFQNYYDYMGNVGHGSEIKKEKIPMVKCSEEVKSYWMGFFSVNPDWYYCIPKGEQLPIIGVLNQGNNTAIRFQTDYCKNNTDSKLGPVKTDCIHKEDTQKLLLSKRIQMHYIMEDILVDTHKYKLPLSSRVKAGIINTNDFLGRELIFCLK